MTALLIFLALATLAAAAFCAGTETSFLSVSRERVLHLAQEGGRKARHVQRALSEMSRTTTTLLIGNNLASVAYSSVTAALIADYCSDSTWRSVWSSSLRSRSCTFPSSCRRFSARRGRSGVRSRSRRRIRGWRLRSNRSPTSR